MLSREKVEWSSLIDMSITFENEYIDKVATFHNKCVEMLTIGTKVVLHSVKEMFLRKVVQVKGV